MFKKLFLAYMLACSSAHAGDVDAARAEQNQFSHEVESAVFWLKEVKKSCPADDFRRFRKYLKTDPRGLKFKSNFDETCARAKTYLFINTRDADRRVSDAYAEVELWHQAEAASAFRDFFLCGGHYVSLC